MDMIIRKADILDAAEMAMIDRVSFDSPWTEEAFHRELTKNRIAFYVVAERGGFVIGYAGLWRVEDEGHITNVAVHPAHRGMHVGQSLLEVLFDVCEKEGIMDYTLEVKAGNGPAICLYEKYGFTREGVRPKYYEGKEDALIMWRRKDKQENE